MRLMASPAEVTGPINLGNPDEYSMLQLASVIIDLTGSKSKIVHRPIPQDDPRQRRPDISKAQEFLGWSPTCKLRDGMQRTIEYFEDLLKDAGLKAAIVADAAPV
jgi:UDP-glucuronate decarboxylase